MKFGLKGFFVSIIALALCLCLFSCVNINEDTTDTGSTEESVIDPSSPTDTQKPHRHSKAHRYSKAQLLYCTVCCK